MRTAIIQLCVFFALVSGLTVNAQPSSGNVIADIQFNKDAIWSDSNNGVYLQDDLMPVVVLFSGNIQGTTNFMTVEPTQGGGGCFASTGGNGALRFNSNGDWAEVTFETPVSKLIVNAVSGSGSDAGTGIKVQVLRIDNRNVVLFEENIILGTTETPITCGEIIFEPNIDQQVPCIVRITRVGSSLRVGRIYAEAPEDYITRLSIL